MAQMVARFGSRQMKTLAALALVGVLGACQADELGYGPKHLRPISDELKSRITRLGMDAKSPIMLRIFKEDSELEVWKQTKSGRYALLETFEICKWSGKLGPKFKEGDRQAPEGFYEITPSLMNPNSSYHLAFNMGYPNKYDRSHNRTGSHLMVHGACSSRGCYAMTDAQVQDIYALARESFKGGQRSFQVQAFPFRMTAKNMAEHQDSPHIDFWRMLKRGSDHFEVTKRPPKVDVCEKRYVFDAVPLMEGVPFRATAKCPAFEIPAAVQQAVAVKQKKDEEAVEQIVASRQRAEERKAQIAAIFGGGADADAGKDAEKAQADPAAGVVTASVPAAADAVPAATGEPSATAFAPEPAPRKSSGGFFGRLFSGDEAAAAPQGASAAAPMDGPAPLPAAKPR